MAIINQRKVHIENVIFTRFALLCFVCVSRWRHLPFLNGDNLCVLFAFIFRCKCVYSNFLPRPCNEQWVNLCTRNNSRAPINLICYFYNMMPTQCVSSEHRAANIRESLIHSAAFAADVDVVFLTKRYFGSESH